MILDKIKAYGAVTLAVILGALLLVQTQRLNSAQLQVGQQKTALATTKQGHAEKLQQISDLTAAAYQAAQRQSNLWAVAQESNANEALEKLARAGADRDAAIRVSTWLQERVNALVTDARRATQDPSTGATVEATEDPVGVLAYMLSRADERAGILAEYGDKARIAGESCERDYEALRQPGENPRVTATSSPPPHAQ